MIDTIRLDKTRTIEINKPNTCPHCDKGMAPVVVGCIRFESFQQPFIYVCFECSICEQVFFAKYSIPTYDEFTYSYEENVIGYCELLGGHGLTREFPKEINDVSPNFVSLYNDAYKAEQHGLQAIVGISYRLAFEYLIKDYCIKNNDDKKDEILKKSLSQCINEYLDVDIKDIAKRAAWLGNDYAHYESKHLEMNVNDLKSVIDICVTKIEAKIKENNYIKNIKKV
ncbi:MAG: DUF4145 domain-containing protein [Firmicutes bacterium]|uniref:DUF4145 domain-containing protein n=1 Tax=Candidatus Alloenteromonas pullistercoris TaxID=2840785 RepID=A0A9D9GT56_9FIRM|nr:DUF4145 domain-containing protein [Candidatus Enteromonas pullistercoris]